MARIAVLLLVRQLGIGGAERDLSRVALRIDRDRFEPHVACLAAAGMRSEELKEAGVPVLELGVRSFHNWSLIEGARRMIRYIAEHRIQLLHTFDSPSSVFAAPFGRLSRARAIMTSQLGHRRYEPPHDRALRKLSDRLSDSIHINSEAMGADLLARGEAVGGKLFLSRNGVDTEVFRPNPHAPRPEAVADASLVVASVCAMRSEKDLKTLISAFAHAKLGDRGAKLLLVGSGPMTEEWRTHALSLGLERACHFEPSTPQVAPWLQAADIFVQTSLHESFSNSLLEAMACGCAVIATDVGGTKELVTDSESGLMIQPGDVEGLAAKLTLLADGKELRQSLAARAVHVANGEFTIENYVRRCSDQYLELLGVD